MSRIMNKIILSGGIRGIDWPQSINLLAKASSYISHSDNFMLKTKGKYDELVLESRDIDSADKKLNSLYKSYLSKQEKDFKSPVNFLSDPIFLDSGATWQTLNSDKTFAFFFCSPEYYLAKIEGASSDGENIDQQECLDNWLEGARKIWEFYVCYPDSTLLINIEDVAKDPLSNASKVFEFLGCELDDTDTNQATPDVATMIDTIETLALLVLQNRKLETIAVSSVLNELYENLAVTSILADNTLSYDASERAGIRLSECQNLIAVIATRQVEVESEVAIFNSSNASLMLDNEQLRASLQQIEVHDSALKTRLVERTAENELALLQIKQLQEELEATYLNSNELKDKLDAGASAAEARILEHTTDNELALLQINQLQEELEVYYLKSEKLNANLAAETTVFETRITKLTTENELAAVKINQQQEELQTAYSNSKELKGESAMNTSAAEARILALTTENELALLQINQLQEELEHYYIQYQQMTYSPQRDITYGADLNRIKHSLSLMNMN
jgi:hypothetical protein